MFVKVNMMGLFVEIVVCTSKAKKIACCSIACSERNGNAKTSNKFALTIISRKNADTNFNITKMPAQPT